MAVAAVLATALARCLLLRSGLVLLLRGGGRLDLIVLVPAAARTTVAAAGATLSLLARTRLLSEPVVSLSSLTRRSSATVLPSRRPVAVGSPSRGTTTLLLPPSVVAAMSTVPEGDGHADAHPAESD